MKRFFALCALAALIVTATHLPADEEDQRLAKSLLSTLKEMQQNGNLRGFDINIEVDNATVWVKGQVDSQQKTRILDIVRRVPGVKQVVNDLTVTSVGNPTPAATAGQTPPAWPQYASYRQISQTAPAAVVKRIVEAIHRMHEQGKLNGDISVELYDGIALLKGKVATEQSRTVLLACVRAQFENGYICDSLQVAEAGKEVTHSVTSKVAAINQLSVPVGAKWTSTRTSGSPSTIHWNGYEWFNSDFNKVDN